MDNVNYNKPILTYPIASSETYYEVVNQRTVYIQGDPKAGFNLYGVIPGWGESSAVNLANILLEFAVTWSTSGDEIEARRQMQCFGRRIGEALVKQRMPTKLVNGVLGCAADALEDVLRSLNAPIARRRTNSEVHFWLGRSCPLHMAAEVTTLEQEVGLAYRALNAICQHVVGTLDPKLRLKLPDGPNVEQVISVVAPTGNGLRRDGYRAWENQAI
jgi:hypothetical protein